MPLVDDPAVGQRLIGGAHRLDRDAWARSAAVVAVPDSHLFGHRLRERSSARPEGVDAEFGSRGVQPARGEVAETTAVDRGVVGSAGDRTDPRSAKPRARGVPEWSAWSSSSTPGLMSRMLEALDVREGHDMLEIGTGTGYNAALLCHRLGSEHVFSVDSDLVLLRRLADRAEGRFERTWAGFMALRPTTPGPTSPATAAGHQGTRDRAQATPRTTKIEQLRPWDNLITWFLAQLTVPGEIGYGHTVRDGRPGDVFLTSADGSWCEVSNHADNDTRQVWEAGPTALWRAVEDADQLWRELGQPGWDRFGLTVTAERQWIWLDSPSSRKLPHGGDDIGGARVGLVGDRMEPGHTMGEESEYADVSIQ